MKICRRCKQELPEEEGAFNHNFSTKDGWHWNCRACDSFLRKERAAIKRQRELAKRFPPKFDFSLIERLQHVRPSKKRDS